MAHQPSPLAALAPAPDHAPERRTRARALLVDIVRAYLDAAAPRSARPGVDRRPTPSVRDLPRVTALAQLESLLAAAGCPLPPPARLDAWRDFAGTESFREVMKIYSERRPGAEAVPGLGPRSTDPLTGSAER